ncbi:hypothetical protein [Streptomyces lanatus]|uniref:Serine/threonine protein kinase n=1 Tax=Streptomyces lanatus TaxID=66900 RepID=A0ABV1XJP3_9ACTN|nr:hypothetical protein [Streptomyces lanatus]GHG95417.1 hypothetical protein GCM10018780_18790 [Streptomyces lanatus]
MSRPPERENAAPQGQPNVYHPRSAAPPAYEEYADPAAAHGWQNGYDETAELPRSVDGHDDNPADAGPRRGRRSGGSGRGVRRRPRARTPRRVVLAAGAVGVSAAALVAGFSLSGSSSDGGSRGKQGDTSPASEVSVDRTGSPGGDPAAPGSSDATGAPPAKALDASPSASASDAAREDDGTLTPSSTPATTGTATPAPTATASTTAPGGGRGDNPGRGLGNTKGPK